MASSSSSSSSFSLFLGGNRASWIAVVVPPATSLIFAMVSGNISFMSISITSLALVISTAIVMALKNKNKSSSEIIKKIAETEQEQQKKQSEEEFDGMGEIKNMFCDDPSSSSSEDYSDIDSTTTHCSESDGSISDDDDEESLFEISLLLPFVANNEKEKEKEDSKNCLVEFLTDMNEEDDNMIEIDISMGSIKCSGFQIEA